MSAPRRRGGGAPVPGSEVSDRASHTFDNTSKSAVRERNLETVIEQATEFWDDARHLRCDWAELMGSTGIRTLETLERAGVLAPGGFVGLDREPAIIHDFAARFPAYKWIGGDLMDVLRDPRLAKVGVLNFDAYDMVGAGATRAVARMIGDIARRSIVQYGAFVLLWNGDLDAVRLHGGGFGNALREHARAIAEALSPALPLRRRLQAEELLPHGEELLVDDPGFTGQVGAFDTYRGKVGGHRMANLRVVLR